MFAKCEYSMEFLSLKTSHLFDDLEEVGGRWIGGGAAGSLG